jgi:cell division protein FtsB
MRLIVLALAALLVLIQYPLWGSWLRVADLETQVGAATKKAAELRARNAKLYSEVKDLKDGTGAVEERARYELGMLKQNEIFIQVLGADGKVLPMATPLPPPPPAGAAAPRGH